MKTFFKVLASIGALVVLAIIAVIFFTAGMSDTADNFFAAVKSKNMDKAYTFLTEDFKNNTSKTDLEKYLKNNSLSNFKEANWDSRSVNGGRGKLTGSITTMSGGVVPLTVNFLKGENEWKIYSIQKPSSGIQEETTSNEIPSEKEQVKLVRESIHLFAVSVKEQNMKKLYNHTSSLFQQQFSIEKFNKVYKSFFQYEDKLMILDNYVPKFTSKATINEDGVLALKGEYPTKPSKFTFSQKYIYEGVSWKLLGFNAHVKK